MYCLFIFVEMHHNNWMNGRIFFIIYYQKKTNMENCLISLDDKQHAKNMLHVSKDKFLISCNSETNTSEF